MIDTSIQRVEINQVIENQLPEFVQSESPLFVDFMKQYYISQEYQGGSINIAENLDRYTKFKHMLVLHSQNTLDYQQILNLILLQFL